jgi:hypothetical protein
MYKIIQIENEKIIQRINFDGSVSFIPVSEENSEYRDYLKSLENEASTL